MSKIDDLEQRIGTLPSATLVRIVDEESYLYSPKEMSIVWREIKRRGDFGVVKKRADEELGISSPSPLESHRELSDRHASETVAVNALKFLAYLYLICSIISSLIIVSNLPDRSLTYAIAIAVALQGVLIWSLCATVSWIAERLSQ